VESVKEVVVDCTFVVGVEDAVHEVGKKAGDIVVAYDREVDLSYAAAVVVVVADDDDQSLINFYHP